MKVALIKYNAGNIMSVQFALNRLGVEPLVTWDHALIRSADKVIFPGVGSAAAAMGFLREKGLDTLIPQLKQPVLGICLGMQLFCRHSEEGDTRCLGIFDTGVRKLPGKKVPHMGWNRIDKAKGPLFSAFTGMPYCYFVHSYYAETGPDTVAVTEYGIPFSSAMQKNNFYGVQFHPEKSAADGEQLIKNFLSI